jgi:hypothetical protein
VSFDTLRVKVGRRPITVVELVLDSCANTYGVLPCTASVPGTGPQKCFNTFATCQDAAHFSKTTKTYKFCSNNAFLPIGENIYPCIEDVDIAATQLNPKGISVNASVTVTLRDFSDHDRGIDPYVSGRSYDPMKQGSFFGKLRARNPFMRNRVIRVNTGYIEADRTIYTQTRTYFVDRIEGPDANGLVKLVGRGIIAFGADDKITVPLKTMASLSASITSSASSLILEPAGVGATFTSSGRLRIDNEVMEYTSKAGDTFTLSVRGSSTAPAPHSAGSAVQQVYAYTVGTTKTIAQVLYDIMTNYGQVDAAYIDMADWTAEAVAGGINGVANIGYLAGLVTAPTAVSKVVKELCQFYGVFLWWDEVQAKLRFKAVGPYGGSVPVLDEDNNILEGSLTVKDLEKERITGLAYAYSTKNIIAKSVEPSDCEYYKLTVDADAESANRYDEAVTVTLNTTWSYAINTFVAVNDAHSRILAWFSETPREFSFKLDAKDASNKTGDLVDILTRLVQSPDGSKVAVRCIITEAQEVERGSQWKYKAQQIKPTN